VTFSPVSPEVMQAAQIAIGVTMVALLASRYLPRYRFRLRVALLVIYLVVIVILCIYAFVSSNAATSA
jgi:hypothetical protein